MTEIEMINSWLITTESLDLTFCLCRMQGRKYELVATITHHGRDPYRGHYTAHAKHANGQWLRFDDDAVAPVGQNEVLHDQAYILFYQQVWKYYAVD